MLEAVVWVATEHDMTLSPVVGRTCYEDRCCGAGSK